MIMQPVTEAYEYGKRIGSDYHGKMPMATKKEAMSDLANNHKYESRLLPQLRDIAGFENQNTTMPTVTVYDQRDCFRDGNNNEQTLLEQRIKPAFWFGFQAGFGI